MLRDYGELLLGHAPSADGDLLSFRPTSSTGMSPALAEVVEVVLRRYGPIVGTEMQMAFNA